MLALTDGDLFRLLVIAGIAAAAVAGGLLAIVDYRRARRGLPRRVTRSRGPQ